MWGLQYRFIESTCIDIKASKFIDTLNAISLIPTIVKPTRVTQTSATLIDNILTNKLDDISPGILEAQISDHFIIFLILENMLENNNNNNRVRLEYRDFNETNLDLFSYKIGNYNMDNFIVENNVNDSLNNFDRILMTEFNCCFPIKSKCISRRENKNKWITSHIKQLIKTREYYSKLLNARRMERREYNRYRNFVSSSIRNAKQSYYDTLFDGIRSDIKKTWNIINSILKPDSQSKKCSINKIVHQGISHNNAESIANCLNSHFSSIGANISNSCLFA